MEGVVNHVNSNEDQMKIRKYGKQGTRSRCCRIDSLGILRPFNELGEI